MLGEGIIAAELQQIRELHHGVINCGYVYRRDKAYAGIHLTCMPMNRIFPSLLHLLGTLNFTNSISISSSMIVIHPL